MNEISMIDRAASEVRVALGDRSYDVLIGGELLEGCADLIRDKVGVGNCAIVTDENVGAIYLDHISENLKNADMFAGAITLAPGEQSKCVEAGA